MRLVEHRGKWAVRIDGRRYSTGIAATADNRAAAERAADQIARALSAPRVGATCREIVDAYFADMPRRATPKQARPEARYSAKTMLQTFGDATPEQVTREACRDYIARRRAQGRSDYTIRNELVVLQAALNWRDPHGPHRVEMPVQPPPRERWLSRAEVDALLSAAAQTPHIALFIHIAVATGARKGAILEMTWSTHVDWDAAGGHGTLWPGFREGGKGRAKPIPMTPTLRAALLDARQNATSAYVIEWAGKPVKSIRRALAAVYARAGVEDVAAPAHVLRHTAGAWMAMAGVPLYEIARRLGHSSIKTTERVYAHFAPEAMSRSTAALDLTPEKILVRSGSSEPFSVNERGTNVKK